MKKVCLSILMLVIFISPDIKAQPYCTPYSYCNYGDNIYWVVFSNLNRTSACDNPAGGYSYFNSPVINVTQLSNYTLKVLAGYNDQLSAWIDYNQDGYFDTSESIFNGYYFDSVNVTIPITALTGTTRLRVQAHQYYYYHDPCTQYFYGETEDYAINISPAPVCSGTPTGLIAISSINYSCYPTDVGLYLDGVENSGLTFQWQSSPDSLVWTNIPGATHFNETSLGPYSASTFFRCLTTCTPSGLFSFSNAVKLTIPSSHYYPPIVATGPLTKCEGDLTPVTLTATGIGPFLWSTGETTNSISLDSYFFPGTYGFWAYNTDSTTCYPDSSHIKSFTIISKPSVYVTDTSTLCIGDTKIIYSTGIFYDTTGFVWSNGATTMNIVVSNAGTYSVSYKGCPSSDSVIVKKTFKTYRPTITIMGNDTICEGTTVVLKANKNKHYLWSTGATTQSIFATGWYSGNIYTVVNPDSNLCISSSNKVTITSKGAPYIYPSGNIYNCPGSPIYLNAYAPWPYTGTNFIWSNGTTGQSNIVTNEGSYNVQMDGCLSLQPAVVINSCNQPYSVSGFAYAVVNHKVTMRITWYGACGIGFQVQYRKSGTTNWTTVNVNSITNFLDINNLNQGNYFECRVRSKCSSNPSTYSVYSNIILFYVPVARLGNDDVPEDSVTYDTVDLGLSLYPNPTDQNLNINFRSEDLKAEMRIFNVNGQLIAEKTLESLEGNFNTIEDVSSLTPGIYFVMITTDSRKISARFIKE